MQPVSLFSSFLGSGSLTWIPIQGLQPISYWLLSVGACFSCGIMTVDADCTVQLDSALDNKYFSLNYKDVVP